MERLFSLIPDLETVDVLADIRQESELQGCSFA